MKMEDNIKHLVKIMQRQNALMDRGYTEDESTSQTPRGRKPKPPAKIVSRNKSHYKWFD